MEFQFLKFSENDLILASVGIVILTIHFLPDTVRNVLIFNHQSPSIFAAFSTHLVHASNQHLLGNVFIGFTALLLLQYFFEGVNREDMFRKLAGFYLLLLPWIITGLSFLIFNLANIDLQNSVGFSALALAFVGSIPPTIFYYIKNSKIEDLSVADSAPFFQIGLVFILASYILIWFNSSIISLSVEIIAVLFLSSLGLLAYSEYRLMEILENKLNLSLKELGNIFSRKEQVVLVFSVLVFVFGALLVAPSSGIVSEGGLVNIISHMVGFTLGFYCAEAYLMESYPRLKSYFQ
ncbi:MAG: hypothetical protein ACI8Z7_000654 [Candidatus Nanohaloarchaea archaeon]|jgi:hypothetical protein